ncbi:serine threonine kinase [Apiospora arundinis]|uniref:Serine threonine kinase n=1 Tax=Apiospora arundinis TaxID=335852 RepID=A0ABR2I9M3_9PEZI
MLQDNATKDALFDGKTAPYLGFLELRDGEEEIASTVVCSQADLEAHLRQGVNDSRFRYISLESPSSREPLDCSLAMFTYLFSYLQIPESSLDYIFTFGRTPEAKDACLTGFQSEDTISMPKERRIGISSLGRSGSEIRMTYLLRVVEKSTDPALISQWAVRQLVVYHSFDVINGRALWITVKGNEETKKHVQSAIRDDSGMQPNSANGTPANFKATMLMQLLLLECCDENVRWHLNDVERVLRGIINVAKAVKLDTDPHFETLPDDIKKKFSRRESTKPTLVDRETLLKRFGTGLSSVFGGKESTVDLNEKPTMVDRVKRAFRRVGKPHLGDSNKNVAVDSPTRLENYLKLDLFSFADLQKLQEIAECIQEGLLAVQMNATVLRDVKVHYRGLMKSRDVPSDIRGQCKPDVDYFTRRIESLESSLGRKQKQWESLEKLAKDGKTLYDGILQYRSLQVSRIYAESAHASALKMEKIAGKTEEDTASMHVITIVTLVFLPGTFFASFLQSGIIQVKEDTDLGEASWRFKGEVFRLFITITLTVMVVTFLFWVVVVKCFRRRSHREDVEADPLVSDVLIDRSLAK